jgi:hypothetical protein
MEGNKMSWVTIYDFAEGYTITDGLQSDAVCDEAIRAAREIARESGCSVVVEDRGTEEFYRVTPKGKILPVPSGWGKPSWEEEEEKSLIPPGE